MIVAGFGFRASATVASLRAAMAATGHPAPDVLATPSDKAHSDCIRQIAQELSLEILPIPPQKMQTMATETHSETVRAKRGTGSVAEACALAAAGNNARLLTPRHVSPDRLATCAIAKGEPQ
ncbi:cobalamin biosynthesis protein [Shimia sp.]|uniref:cobalamin biosynthesis protein n=1 Tax=Shimia sp. TaxID=1954381 RepID=UPI003298DA31